MVVYCVRHRGHYLLDEIKLEI